MKFYISGSLGPVGVFQELAEHLAGSACWRVKDGRGGGGNLIKEKINAFPRVGFRKLTVVRRVFLVVQKPSVGAGFYQPLGTTVSLV